MSVTLLTGDCREILPHLEAGSVQTVVTSPPYWGLRNYKTPPSAWGGDPACAHDVVTSRPAPRNTRGPGSASTSTLTNPQRQDVLPPPSLTGDVCRLCGAWFGALGLEPTPDLYVAHLVEVFRHVRRVLRDDGTVWLNLGDCYNGARSGGQGVTGQMNDRSVAAVRCREMNAERSAPGLKPKDLVGIPWAVAFALRNDGWWLRKDIIWHKPNPMPESITDRPTTAHEYVFLLSKSEVYFYDHLAIAEPSTYAGKTVKTNGASGMVDGMFDHRTRAGFTRGVLVKKDRNKRSVWSVKTEPSFEPHYAAMLTKLVAPCIKAGTSERGACGVCRAPWARAKPVRLEPPPAEPGAWWGAEPEAAVLEPEAPLRWEPTCDHLEAATVPCLVLDPFGGTGTVARVAEDLGRDSICVEVNPAYQDIATRRTAQGGLTLVPHADR